MLSAKPVPVRDAPSVCLSLNPKTSACAKRSSGSSASSPDRARGRGHDHFSIEHALASGCVTTGQLLASGELVEASSPILRTEPADHDDMKLAALVQARRLARFPYAGKTGAVRAARTPTPDGLLNLRQAAAYLAIGVSLLRQHIKAGRLKFTDIGRGTKRRCIRFTRADLEEFKARQRTSGEVGTWQNSTSSKTRRTGNSTSGSRVVAFTALPRPRTGVKPKP